MATINNPEAIKRILDDAGIQTSIDDVPKELASKVVPVLIANPKLEKNPFILLANKTSTGSTVMTTTSKTKETYVTGILLGYICDAAADTTHYDLTLQSKGGKEDILIKLNKPTLTASFREIWMPFPIPLLLEPNSQIEIEHTFSVGTSQLIGRVVGFTVETTLG